MLRYHPLGHYWWVAVVATAFTLATTDANASKQKVIINLNKAACTALSDPAKYNKCAEKVRKNQPVFIFIPGILGSMLKDAQGNILWGTANAAAKELDFTKNPEPLPASEIGSFSVGDGLYKQEIYGKVVNAIRGKDLGRVPNFFYFAYDWRQDNRVSAQKFDDWLRSEKISKQIKDRKLVILAHSMGGLLYRYWRNKIFNGQAELYSFKEIVESIFVAVPHYGAPQALYRIVEAELFEGLQAISLDLFGDLPDDMAAVGYSFPSVYQLLPEEQLCTVQLMGGNCGNANINVFDPRVWRDLKFMRKVANSAQRPESELYDYADPILESAFKFHQEIGKCDELNNATFFSSSDQKTLDGAVVDITYQHETGLDIFALFRENKVSKTGAYDVEVHWQETDDSGDGTVPHLIAECGKTVNILLRPNASGDHIDIMHSEKLLDHIVGIRETAIARANAEISRAFENSLAFINGSAKQGRLLEVPIKQGILNDNELAKIKAMNTKILARIKDQGKIASFVRQTSTSGLQNSAMDALIVEYSPSKKLRFAAAQSIAFDQFKQGERWAILAGTDSTPAQANFKTGISYSKVAVSDASTFNDLGVAFNTLGLLQARTGEPEEALQQIRSAANWGNEKAIGNLPIIQKTGGQI